MDAQAKKKAFFRAKLNAQKKEKQRVDSPLVRYNEHDQPVCRVCDVIIKSESLWPAHQASRKHHEAINNLKANAAALNQTNTSKSESLKEPAKSKPEHDQELHIKTEHSTAVPKSGPSSRLPPDFFDSQKTKRQKNETDAKNTGNPTLHKNVSAQFQVHEAFESGSNGNILSNDKSGETRSSELQHFGNRQASKTAVVSEAKQVKGALPEGFFDDKDADLRARGITPVKPDVKDEYKEFEKLIQDDLQEIDNRMEEDEFYTAEVIEKTESIEQRTYKERIEMLRRKKLEMKAVRDAAESKKTEVKDKETSHEESSSDDDSDENLTVDWRAKRF